MDRKSETGRWWVRSSKWESIFSALSGLGFSLIERSNTFWLMNGQSGGLKSSQQRDYQANEPSRRASMDQFKWENDEWSARCIDRPHLNHDCLIRLRSACIIDGRNWNQFRMIESELELEMELELLSGIWCMIMLATADSHRLWLSNQSHRIDSKRIDLSIVRSKVDSQIFAKSSLANTDEIIGRNDPVCVTNGFKCIRTDHVTQHINLHSIMTISSLAETFRASVPSVASKPSRALAGSGEANLTLKLGIT